MFLDSDLNLFLKHPEWYNFVPGEGYIPTEEAPSYAKKQWMLIIRKILSLTEDMRRLIYEN